MDRKGMPRTWKRILEIVESKEHRSECPDHEKCGLYGALELLVKTTMEETGRIPLNEFTKREEFAKAAMQGFSSAPNMNETSAKKIAALAIEQADAMIEELNKEKTS